MAAGVGAISRSRSGELALPGIAPTHQWGSSLNGTFLSARISPGISCMMLAETSFIIATVGGSGSPADMVALSRRERFLSPCSRT